MKWHGVSVTNNGDFVFTRPRLYTGSEWKDGTYYVYDGTSWKMIGGACTQMIQLVESNGGDFGDNETSFLVRQPYINNNMLLKSADGKYLLDAGYNSLYIISGGNNNG